MISASIFSVGQYVRSIVPLLIWSLIKWSWTSTYYVFAWFVGFFASPRSRTRYWSQINSFVACIMAAYSPSTLDWATLCFFARQLIASPAWRKRYPESIFCRGLPHNLHRNKLGSSWWALCCVSKSSNRKERRMISIEGPEHKTWSCRGKNEKRGHRTETRTKTKDEGKGQLQGTTRYRPRFRNWDKGLSGTRHGPNDTLSEQRTEMKVRERCGAGI